MAKTKVKNKSVVTDLDDIFVESVYINPLTDFGFKRLFYNKELLIPFLNAVVGTDIKDITYQPTEGLGWFSEERTAVFDLLCTTKNETQFVVEMQLGKQTYFRERALFYGSHIIRKQAPRRKYWDFNLKPVYIVSILNFNIFNDETSKEKVIERVYLYRETLKERFSDKLQMIFVELPKFNKEASELHDNTDTWLYLLKNTFGLKTCPPEITGKIFKLFLENAEIKQLTPTEMKTYEVSLKRSYQMRVIANCTRMEGRLEGRMEGKMEGMVEKSKQFAIKLMMMNEPIDKIISLTELSREELTELIGQLPEA
jgi:predicted transposase/invertase (TIGR01784 family)